MTPSLAEPSVRMLLWTAIWSAMVCSLAAGDSPPPTQEQFPPPPELAQFFQPPEKYRHDFGNFRSPLLFADGTPVKTPADWHRRRQEILTT